jgi:hypothetical protein
VGYYNISYNGIIENSMSLSELEISRKAQIALMELNNFVNILEQK